MPTDSLSWSYLIKTHLRVVAALLIRETSARFGNKPGGYIWALLESVRKVIQFVQSLLSMRRMDANLRKASALRDMFSKSLASLRQRPSHAKVLSTTQRLGKTSKPLAVSERLTISVARPGMAFFCPLAKTGP